MRDADPGSNGTDLTWIWHQWIPGQTAKCDLAAAGVVVPDFLVGTLCACPMIYPCPRLPRHACGPTDRWSLQMVFRECPVSQDAASQIDDVTMVRKQHHLPAFGELRQGLQDVAGALIVRGDQHVVQHQRHLRV